MNTLGNNIIFIDKVDSTNNYAIRQITENKPKEGTVFLAESQIAGRGQGSNFWESEPGANLTFSLILCPNFIEILDQYMLSKVVTLGLTDWLKNIVDNVSIKWPNDIYVGQQKIAGILIENSLQGACISYSVVGIGFNVNQLEFKSDAPNPVSLSQLTSKQWNLNDVLSSICNEMNKWYERLRNGDREQINSAFEKRMMGINSWAQFAINKSPFEAKVKGVNSIGQLVLENREGELLEFHNKEVQYVIGSLEV